MGHKIVNSIVKPFNIIEGEQEAQEGEESKPARKRVRGHNTEVCVVILQVAVVEDAKSGVLGQWLQWICKPVRRPWTGNQRQIG